MRCQKNRGSKEFLGRFYFDTYKGKTVYSRTFSCSKDRTSGKQQSQQNKERRSTSFNRYKRYYDQSWSQRVIR